jgi:hypothetical protein
LARLRKLSNLEENWDSYGARPVKPESLAAAFWLLGQLSTTRTPKPTLIAPTPAGHIQIEWHLPHIELELEVPSPTRVEVAYEIPGPTVEEDVFFVTSNYERLSDLMARLSAPFSSRALAPS